MDKMNRDTNMWECRVNCTVGICEELTRSVFLIQKRYSISFKGCPVSCFPTGGSCRHCSSFVVLRPHRPIHPSIHPSQALAIHPSGMNAQLFTIFPALYSQRKPLGWYGEVAVLAQPPFPLAPSSRVLKSSRVLDRHIWANRNIWSKLIRWVVTKWTFSQIVIG